MSRSSQTLGSKDPAGTEKVRKIAEKCKSGKTRFVDDEFPATERSIWKNPADKGKFLKNISGIEWKRPEEIGNPKYDWNVFKSGISADDIIQGNVGDCYFLAALASVASQPLLIDNLIVEEYCDQGVYGVKFFRMGRWETVVIDDLFPCELDTETNQWKPIFASYSSNDKEIWMMLAEKAWAKMHGCYQIIANGTTPDTMCYLTGGHAVLFHLSDEHVWNSFRKGFLWKKLYRMVTGSNATEFVFLSSSGVEDDDAPLEVGGLNENDDDAGLMGDHAYSILEMKEFPDPKRPQGTLQLIKVRNPWGSYEWKGEFSDKSPSWTDKLKKACNLVDASDGAFWMTFQDFADYFSFIGCCVTHGPAWAQKANPVEWKAGISAGGREDDTYRYNPTFLLKNSTHRVVLQVEQDEIRDNDPVDMYFFDIFVNVTRKHPTRNYADVVDTVHGFSDIHDHDDPETEPRPFRLHSSQRNATLEMHLEPGEYLVTVTMFHPGFEGNAVIVAFSTNYLEFTPFRTPEPSPEAKKKMAKQVLYSGAPTCCITGVPINVNDPDTFRVRKGVFWDISAKSRNFRCGRCLKSFDDALPFFDIGKFNNKWSGYCELCFKQCFYPRCMACGKAIYDTVACNSCNGSFIRIEGGRVHEDCYVRYQLKNSKSNVICPLPPKLADGATPQSAKIPLVITVKNTPESIKGLRAFLDK